MCEELEAVAGQRLPVVVGAHHRLRDRHLEAERAHFVTPGRFGRRRSDQCGHLELTSGRLRFHGALDVGVAWSEVEAIDRSGHEIVVQLATSPRVLRFSCYAAAEAARAALIAQRLAQESHTPQQECP